MLPPRFALYQALSERVMAVLAEAAPVLEPVSLDEAFLEPPDLVGAAPAAVHRFGPSCGRRCARRPACRPRSVPGPASSWPRSPPSWPNRTVCGWCARDEQQAVLDPLPVRALWGVGPVAETGLRRLGVHTIGQLAAMDLREVTDLLGGAVGTELHRLARGVDDRPVAAARGGQTGQRRDHVRHRPDRDGRRARTRWPG